MCSAIGHSLACHGKNRKSQEGLDEVENKATASTLLRCSGERLLHVARASGHISSKLRKKHIKPWIGSTKPFLTHINLKCKRCRLCPCRPDAKCAFMLLNSITSPPQEKKPKPRGTFCFVYSRHKRCKSPKGKTRKCYQDA